jgi:hypothetical protein
MFTLSEIKSIKKNRAAASRAYAAALAAYDAIPDRHEVEKEAALTAAQVAHGKLEQARAAMSEITRQANRRATEVYNSLYNPLGK